MKNKSIILILLIGLIVNNAYAQDKDGIYIIVNAHKSNISYDPNYNVLRHAFYGDRFRDSVQEFRMYVPFYKVPIMYFWHFYSIKPKVHEVTVNPKDQHKIFLKDSSFLNSVNCLFWDDVKDLDYGDAKEYVGKLLFKIMPDGSRVKRTIYVVDLAEKHPNGKIKLYKVEDMTKEWTKTIYRNESDKQEWIKHTKEVKEKIDKRRADRKAKQFKR